MAMCGRFTLITPARELADELGLPYETVLAGLEPRYNIAPSQLVPVLLAEGGLHMALFIRLKSRRPFTFAGLWSSWTSPSGVDVLTRTIITGEANELIAKIHQRMPVIVPPEAREIWLDPRNQDTESLRAILKPFAPEKMEMFPVSRHVNSPRNDDPLCVEPAEEAEAEDEPQS